jgi:hypothetical protein
MNAPGQVLESGRVRRTRLVVSRSTRTVSHVPCVVTRPRRLGRVVVAGCLYHVAHRPLLMPPMVAGGILSSEWIGDYRSWSLGRAGNDWELRYYGTMPSTISNIGGSLYGSHLLKPFHTDHTNQRAIELPFSIQHRKPLYCGSWFKTLNYG